MGIMARSRLHERDYLFGVFFASGFGMREVWAYLLAGGEKRRGNEKMALWEYVSGSCKDKELAGFRMSP